MCRSFDGEALRKMASSRRAGKWETGRCAHSCARLSSHLELDGDRASNAQQLSSTESTPAAVPFRGKPLLPLQSYR